ncbi:LLM class flavin-dependent oxidoreductase [Williamsia phyllosphaerae]|uniref:5,10-methylenetetrahydromethanopterin reductase n=1 Tax=Williamsia phyllosphaerae TaxID=885042 RepID=A0ABQ1U8B2_9NOCA|nr:LLM class flavin-dependent oxidoreductase [Williamsia phyllosphaerae]GGF11607.1 5,10-methylenetetrahydromethanopterin reductase [Williamsia phyllosphaerae]
MVKDSEHGLEVGLGWAGAMRPGEYGPLAAYAEKAGVDSLIVYSDLMFQPPLGPLLEMANATKSVSLTLGCLTPFTVHPVEIAGQLAYLDAASDGRATLGLVRGAWLEKLGLDQRRTITAIRETCEIVTRLLSGDRSGFDGKVFTLGEGLGLQYSPRRTEVPLTIGTWSPKLASLAGELADEVEVGGTANPDMVEVIRRMTMVGTEMAGRPSDALEISFNPMLVIDDDGEKAEALARTMGAMYVAVVGAHDPTVELDPEMVGKMNALIADDDHEGAGRLISPGLLRKFLICGTPSDAIDHLLELEEAGVDRVYLGNPFGLDEDTGLRLLAEKVLPGLRSRGSREA